MEMSIDEAIYCMKSYLPSDEYTHCTECKYYGCKDNNTCASNETHQMAIDIMHKYKKIQELVTNNELEWGNTSVRANVLWDVKKVVEDGNI